MVSEPYKIKEVKEIRRLSSYERWNALKRAHFNTFRLESTVVTFDLVAQGMSSWSHFQKAGYMVGDEAYAGSANFGHLEEAARKVLGVSGLVPAHNGIGAEKLVATTMIVKGQTVAHNRGRVSLLVQDNHGLCVDVTGKAAAECPPPSSFGADLDLDRLSEVLEDKKGGGTAYVHVQLCPDGWNGQPVSLKNLREVKRLAQVRGVPLLLDISNVIENALFVLREERGGGGDLMEVVREIVSQADVVMMDGSQDGRADVGGFVASGRKDLFEKFLNQVVVFEGLHTYGGMTGRAMEVLAVGIEEMARPEYAQWYAWQVAKLGELISKKGVPIRHGTKGVCLDVREFLPKLGGKDCAKFVLSACLYLRGGLRPRIDGSMEYHRDGNGARWLNLELPRHAYTINHLEAVARAVESVWRDRDRVAGLRLANEPEFVDQAGFEPASLRLIPAADGAEEAAGTYFEPFKIAIFEPIQVLERSAREKVIREAGYNTFLLPSKDVAIDLLTDSGTSAMSCYQWEGMTNSADTPFSSRHYASFVEEFRGILGFEHILPTHQGRAAEHIMSQVMIKPGQIVPGNMYFTTTKLHQEMAGGIFEDVIIDSAHDTASTDPWKGNVDLAKMDKLAAKHGAGQIAYISFELSVNMAGGQPVSMDNLRAVSAWCQRHGVPLMFDATRCVENAYMIKFKDARYRHKTVKEILREMMAYGDGCTISCKKDFLVNMGGLLACNDASLAERFRRMLRVWEGDVTNGGLDAKDMEALRRGLLDSLDDDYIAMRVQQTQEFGRKLNDSGVPIVNPPGSHAIFLDAKRFLPHIDQDEYPAQALSAAIYIETGVRTMERGNVSKGRDPKTGKNYRPVLELVRCTIPRRVYSDSHMDFVVEGIKGLYAKRDAITGLKFVYEPPVLRFFQGRFEPVRPWKL